MPRHGKYNQHLRGDGWYKKHKFPGKCVKCGKAGQKSDFIPLFVRVTSYESHRILCRLCHDCLTTLAHDLGVEIPE